VGLRYVDLRYRDVPKVSKLFFISEVNFELHLAKGVFRQDQSVVNGLEKNAIRF